MRDRVRAESDPVRRQNLVVQCGGCHALGGGEDRFESTVWQSGLRGRLAKLNYVMQWSIGGGLMRSSERQGRSRDDLAKTQCGSLKDVRTTPERVTVVRVSDINKAAARV